MPRLRTSECLARTRNYGASRSASNQIELSSSYGLSFRRFPGDSSGTGERPMRRSGTSTSPGHSMERGRRRGIVWCSVIYTKTAVGGTPEVAFTRSTVDAFSRPPRRAQVGCVRPLRIDALFEAGCDEATFSWFIAV